MVNSPLSTNVIPNSNSNLGSSVPVANFTTDSLRFLNNAQAAADSANFMRNVRFAGIAEDLTAPGTPWIYYGGSYAGARSAHMKVLYPDIVWGAIASSGVTYANLEDWQYMDIIRRFADSKCSEALVNSIAAIDDVLLHGSAAEKHQLKALFGLAGLEHDDDFANVLQGPLGAWQNQNWVPSLASTKFTTFCQALTAPSGNLSQRDLAQPFDHPDRRVVLDARTTFAVDASVANYAAYINSTTASRCKTTAESCFGSNNVTSYQQTGLDQTWRLWQFQVCTEWGFFTTAPPPNVPRIISKLSTLEYQSKICKQAYPPGKHFRVPPQPDVEVVNRLGGFDIAADRLAIIDGEDDPWRPNTPHSDDAKPRKDTTLRPFKLIPNGVHHYDEYGLADPTAEPPQIQLIHSQMVDFVKSWLEDWNIKHSIKTK
ncbi:peptidase S28 [Panaeolus papilionaceus]|nr:peptidase S28 [Panaeolus papilionaceus]